MAMPETDLEARVADLERQVIAQQGLIAQAVEMQGKITELLVRTLGQLAELAGKVKGG